MLRSNIWKKKINIQVDDYRKGPIEQKHEIT